MDAGLQEESSGSWPWIGQKPSHCCLSIYPENSLALLLKLAPWAARRGRQVGPRGKNIHQREDQSVDRLLPWEAKGLRVRPDEQEFVVCGTTESSEALHTARTANSCLWGRAPRFKPAPTPWGRSYYCILLQTYRVCMFHHIIPREEDETEQVWIDYMYIGICKLSCLLFRDVLQLQRDIVNT